MTVAAGDKVTGKITGITSFGAFVDLGQDQNGLVHISEVSDDYVKDIHDYVSVGDEVPVVVTKVGKDGKIALSMRKAQPRKAKTKEASAQQPPRQSAPRRTGGRHKVKSTSDFDRMMDNFLKDSDERLSSLRKNTEGKRGGRGGRRK